MSVVGQGISVEMIPLTPVGSIRRDCLDHFVILNTRHLKRTLSSYFAYYHESRTHLGLDKHVRTHGRSRVLEGSSRFRTSAACITVMNALQRNAMPADAFLANDRVFLSLRLRLDLLAVLLSAK